MTAGTTSGIMTSGSAWASTVLAQARARSVAGQSLIPAPTRPQGPAPAPTVGFGHDRALLDGVSSDQPLDMIPAFFTNVVEKFTGSRDERSGKALGQILLAGTQLVQAGLRAASHGSGVVAAGSSILGKVLPIVSIGSGAIQIWKGWNELESHADGPLSIIHSRTGRTGLIQVLAGALLFLPGVGTALGGAALRLVAAANELDAFASLDQPTQADTVAAAAAATSAALTPTPLPHLAA